MPNNAPTVSVCMIVKNEEKVLADCLESVKDADEIVIVDTGSEDRTVEIAEKYTDKVYHGEEYLWRDDFAFSRNQAIEKCTGDWILIIDADEFLEESGMVKIRGLKELTDPGVAVLGFRCVSKNKSMTHYAPRLFRNNRGIKYNGAIHNHLSKLADINTDITITYGYSPAHRLDPDRALRILTKEVEKNPNAAREMFYLAREYTYRKDWTTALDWYGRYLKIARWGPEIAEAQLQVAKCLRHLKRYTDARMAALSAVMVNADFREAWVFLADLSGPNNRARLLEHAAICQNRDVLFTREVKI